MPDYNNGKIYCIRSHQTDDVYIGSTTQKLCRRMTDHRKDYNGWVNGKRQYMTSYEIIKLCDAYIELLELFPCGCKDELHKKECEYIRNMKCVNKCIPGRTQKEYRKEYYNKNKDNINKKNKEYYEKNKSKMAKNMEKYRKMNKCKIKKYMKEYYKNNKYKKKQYYEKNRENILKQQKERRAKKKLEKKLSTDQ